MFKIKYDNKLNRGLTNSFGLIALIIGLGVFITGKTDLNSFFENITIGNLLMTFIKTIASYLSTLTFLLFAIITLFIDLFLWIFQSDFRLTEYSFDFFINTVTINWWWNGSLPENIFLSVGLFFLLFSVQFETKTKVISLFYDRWGKKLNGFQIGVFLQTYRDRFDHNMKISELNESDNGGVSIGFIIIRDKVKTLLKNEKTKHNK